MPPPFTSPLLVQLLIVPWFKPTMPPPSFTVPLLLQSLTEVVLPIFPAIPPVSSLPFTAPVFSQPLMLPLEWLPTIPPTVVPSICPLLLHFRISTMHTPSIPPFSLPEIPPPSLLAVIVPLFVQPEKIYVCSLYLRSNLAPTMPPTDVPLSSPSL